MGLISEVTVSLMLIWDYNCHKNVMYQQRISAQINRRLPVIVLRDPVSLKGSAYLSKNLFVQTFSATSVNKRSTPASG